MSISVPKSILIIGTWYREIYEQALSHGLQSHGWETIPFKIGNYLNGPKWADYLIRARFSPILSRLNASLLKLFEKKFPAAVLFNRTDLILPNTLKRMKEISSDSVLILYHNDDPFIGLLTKFKMRHYLKSIPLADVTLVYRPSNIKEALKRGAKRTELLQPYYLSYRHKPFSPSERSDVIYIGHYAPDGRANCLDYLVRNGIKVRVYGARWEKAKKKYKWLCAMHIREVWGKEYSSLLSSAKIALVFLSTKNRDVYTRRCFEIPACGTLMMAPRTRELEELFTDREEAVYYDSQEDLLQKIWHYLHHDEERIHIARAGRKRCLKDGHDEIARARRLIETIEDVKKAS